MDINPALLNREGEDVYIQLSTLLSTINEMKREYSRQISELQKRITILENV